jgi:hypothetical protein
MITIPFDDFNRKSNILDFNQRKKTQIFLSLHESKHKKVYNKFELWFLNMLLVLKM